MFKNLIVSIVLIFSFAMIAPNFASAAKKEKVDEDVIKEIKKFVNDEESFKALEEFFNDENLEISDKAMKEVEKFLDNDKAVKAINEIDKIIKDNKGELTEKTNVKIEKILEKADLKVDKKSLNKTEKNVNPTAVKGGVTKYSNGKLYVADKDLKHIYRFIDGSFPVVATFVLIVIALGIASGGTAVVVATLFIGLLFTIGPLKLKWAIEDAAEKKKGVAITFKPFKVVSQ